MAPEAHRAAGVAEVVERRQQTLDQPLGRAVDGQSGVAQDVPAARIAEVRGLCRPLHAGGRYRAAFARCLPPGVRHAVAHVGALVGGSRGESMNAPYGAGWRSPVSASPSTTAGASRPTASSSCVLKAILAACEDAGIDPRDIDGYCSYSNDRNLPTRIHTALGCEDIRFSNMQWGCGRRRRPRRGRQRRRGRRGRQRRTASSPTAASPRASSAASAPARGGPQDLRRPRRSPCPTAQMSPAQTYAMRVKPALRTNTASAPTPRRRSRSPRYHHAQHNPRAVMHGRPLTPEGYDESRWIVEPFRLFDCCLENDGAAALIVTSAERAKDLTDRPAYLLGAQQGGAFRSGAVGAQRPRLRHLVASRPPRPASTRRPASTPADVDVAQIYENFTGGVVMSLIEHGFCSYEEANEFITYENLSPRRQAAAQHQRRQPRRVLHARPRPGHRGRPPDARRLPQPGARRQGQLRGRPAPMVDIRSAADLRDRGGAG